MRVALKNAKFISLLFLLAAFAQSTARAQDVRLQLGELDKLQAKAAESVDVSLDGPLLRIGISLLKEKKPEEAAIKELVIGLKGIYVKVFEFDKEGEYSSSDLETIRTQLRAPAWSRMVGVKSRKEGDNLEVYTMMSGNLVNGIAVIANRSKQLAVIQIVINIIEVGDHRAFYLLPDLRNPACLYIKHFNYFGPVVGH